MKDGNGHSKKFLFDDFRLETELQTLRRGADEIHLAKRPFQVLNFLIEHRDRLVSRDELLAKFWDGHEVYDDALRKCIGAIRKALNDTKESPRYIEVKRGSGYRFIGDVEQPDVAEPHYRRQENGARNLAAATGNSKNAEQRTWSSRSVSRGLIAAFAVAVISLAIFGSFAYRRLNGDIDAKTLPVGLPTKRSIAILPLKNLTGNPANDYLSDGITESLINELSRVESLKVISRSSAFQFKDKDVSAEEMGERLGVETILEGGFKQSGDQLRVEVRLVDAKDGGVIWASNFEQKKLADVFTIQDGITCQIVTELKVKLCGDVPLATRYTKNVEAYQLYLHGLYYRNRIGADDLKKAVQYYTDALKIDPNYALAHDGLANAYTLMELNSYVPPGSVAPLAEDHANKALALDDSLAGAYLSLGVVKTMKNYDLTERERYYRLALAKNPNHRTAHLWLGDIYMARGEFEKAEAEIFAAQEIDPLSAGVRLTLEDLYFYWRKPDKILEQANLVLATQPNDQQAIIYVALSYMQKGDFEKSFAALEKLPADDPTRAFVLAAAGRTAEARAFAEAASRSDAAKNNPYSVARLYAISGNKEAAFTWLEKSYAVRQADLVSMKIDPSLDLLHDDPRYLNLLGRVNLQ